MKRSTSELTIEYIKEHPYIANCLKKDLINYSSLARLISKDLKIEKKTSKEAILVAAIRYKDSLKKEISNDNRIKELISNSEISIKNKISVLITGKRINLDSIVEFQKKIKKTNGIMYLLEGTDSYTIITQDVYAKEIKEELGKKIIQSHESLAFINFRSSEKIEQTPGVISYITSIFAENGVNILEFISCWKDTILVIDKKDVNKAISFLEF